MIGTIEFAEACDYAHAFAVDFTGRHISGLDFFPIDTPELYFRSTQYEQIRLFATSYGFQVLPFDRSRIPPNYASFLFLDPISPDTIGLSIGQMRVWRDHEGLPISVQAIRSVLHEIGHRFLTVPRRGPLVFVAPFVANAVEEDAAWAFCMTFLALLAGDYAELRRAADIDDFPKHTT